jgi:hypothetical protein
MGSERRDEIGADPGPAGPDHDMREGEFHGVAEIPGAMGRARWRPAAER